MIGIREARMVQVAANGMHSGPCGAPVREPAEPGRAWTWTLIYLLPALRGSYVTQVVPLRCYAPLHRHRDPYAA